VYASWISAAAVRDPCFVPEKVEPATYSAIVIKFAALIREESDTVRENMADFSMINTAKIENLFRQHHVAVFVAL